MWTHHLRTALRHVRRHPVDAGLNVLGLAVGLALFGLVALYVGGETSVDRFHPDAERVVRLSTLSTGAEGEVRQIATGPGPLGEVVRTEVPGVEAVARLLPTRLRVDRGGEYLLAPAYWADASFFDVFGFELAAGDPATALSRPGTVVLTEEAAERLTGERRPLGQTVVVGDTVRLVVSGVIAGPARSHLQFDALRPLAEIRDGWGGGAWFSFNAYTYARLRPEASVAAVAAAVRGIAQDRNREQFEALGVEVVTLAEPVASLYFSPTEDFQNAYGDRRMLTLLSAVALGVLAVAGINFVNLATARGVERAREVGVRKAVGAGHGGLVRQFLTESVGLAVAAGAVGLALVTLALPAFNALVGSDLAVGSLLRPGVAAVALAVVVGVGLIAGAYPAFALARFRPVEALRGLSAGGRWSGRLRQGLVVFQFVVSTALLVATLVVGAQLQHLRSQDDGFERERMLVVSAEDAGAGLRDGRDALLKAAVERIPGVEAAAWTLAPPGVDGWTGQLVQREGGSDEDARTMETVIADPDYAEALGLEVVAGRDLDADRAGDVETGVLLNETGARTLGWTPEDAVGKRVYTSGRDPGEVVGVVRDYRHHGAGVAVGPQVLFRQGAMGGELLVRASPEALGAVRERVAAVWAERLPGYAFKAQPLDAVFDAQYEAEQRLARAFAVFAALAVVVACLGLFGLAAYAVQRRTKEVGVRKVLGASVLALTAHLSRDFARPVVLGFVIAAPLAWWGLSRWLDGFAERVVLTPFPFLLAGAVALAVALVTVGAHTLRVATSDPVKALRSE